MVTKTTSLIVLDDIADYVTYKITPPTELQEEYYALLAKKKKEEKLSLEERLDDVHSLYKKKVDWWKTDWKKVAEKQKEKARIDSIQRIERARLDRIKARNKFIVDSTAKAEEVLLYNKNKAIADSLKIIEKIKNDSLLAIRNASPIKEISGIIFSAEDNLPLPGVTIVVIGTANGTISDIDGRFSLSVPDKSILSFHSWGFFEQQIDVSNLYNLAVILKNDTSDLQGIIIMGSRIESRSYTGSVSMVTAANISNDRNQVTTDKQMDNLHSTIELKDWNPEVPYLDSLKKVKLPDAYNKHLEMSNQYLKNPSYFLDVANFFMSHNDKDNAIRVLSNLSEMQMQDHEILRVLGRKLLEFGETDAAIAVFKQVLELRPFEPHSYRDLGLAYAENKEYQKAVETLYKVITTQWSESIAEKFEEIETIVIGEMNSIIIKAGKRVDVSFIDKRFLVNLPVDIRVVLNWDADNTDMDLWVTDPENEKCFYKNRHTKIGGYVSEDLIEGYGPEEFLLKNAIEGNYKIEVNYYSSSQQTISGPVTIQVLLYSNFGKPNETMKRMTVRLSENKEVIHIGDLLFELNK
ncbi:MAG TPA: DUF2135 domain-containing protein [Edaphocola sp.]|nr:DUF2135 domain-containing protein [Edaphocola sp.]